MSQERIPGRPLRLYTNQNSHIDMSTETIVGERLNFYQGWKCAAGVENIYIDMDGKVFSASCRVGGQYGNIFSDFKAPSEWIDCSKKACACGADLFIRKYKSKEHKNLFDRTQNPTTQQLFENIKETPEFVALERVDEPEIKQVYWEMGRRCNYDCSYCWPAIHNKTDPHKSLQELIGATILIEENFCRGVQTHFVISGGEPTINIALMDWVKFIYSLGHKISMHSNGSRNPEYYKELIHYTNLNLSIHFEFVNKERVLKVIDQVTQEKIRVKNKNVGHLEVKLMMPPGFAEEALEFENEVSKISGFKDYCTKAIVPIRDGTLGDQIKLGYKESDFKLFGDRSH